MRWSQASIVRRLLVLTVVAGLVTGVVGVAVVGVLAREDLRDEAAAANLAAAQRIATAVDARLSALRSQLQLLATRQPVATFTDAETELAVALRASDDLDSLVLHDRSGRAVAASSSSRLLAVEELEPRPELIGSLTGSGPIASVVRDDGSLPSFELAVPVEDPPGRIVGALVGRAPAAIVVQDSETGERGDGVEAFLVESDGTLVAHPELDRVIEGEVYPLGEVFPEGRRVARLREDGDPLLAAVAPVDALSAAVVVEQPEATAVRSLGSTTGGVIAVFLAVIAAIVVAVALAGHRLLRPVRPLVEAVDRLGHGELGVRVEPSKGGGEVRVLADGFNRMAAALQARQRELEEAERAARRSEERLRLMVEGVEEYAIVLLDLDGRVRSWNTGARRLLGTDAESAVGRRLSSYFDPGEPPQDPLADTDAGRPGDVEGWCRREDGSRFWGRIVANALHDEAGEPYGYAVVLHDLTERHAARRATEDALEREQQAAAELRRTNELKDEFLAVAAHEIRTPLSAILGASHVLSREWGQLDEAERLRFRDMIEAHAQDMRALVERLLDMTRLQAGRVRVVPENVRLDEELKRDVQLVGSEIDGHEVVVEAPPVTVHLDPQSLRHIVTNLLSNAAKFSEAGSTIRLAGAVDGDTVTVEVTDRGIGIAPEHREHIFELFHQTDDGTLARGTGVGLAIVRRYAELTGGAVEVESTPGEGSTFRVTLRTGPGG